MLESMQATFGLFLKALALISFYAQPTYGSMATVIILITVDFVTGVWAAKKRGEKITSWGWRRTIHTKMVPYYIALLCAHLVDLTIFKGTVLESLQLMKATAAFIAGAELKSVFENLGSISGLDFWTFIKEKLQPQKSKPDA